MAAAIYGTTLVIQFAVSAIYHRPMWQPEVRQKLRRLDHAAIYLLIAGTATPLSMMLNSGARLSLLAIMWGIAIAGILLAPFSGTTDRNRSQQGCTSGWAA